MENLTQEVKQIKVKKGSIKEAVINWSNEDQENYPEKSKLEDLQSHGCISGMVSDLIYYADTVKFYKAHKKEIISLVSEFCENTGETLKDFISHANNFPLECTGGYKYGEDKNGKFKVDSISSYHFVQGIDGLIKDFPDYSDQIMNWFAWFGFEETAYQYYSEKYEN